MKAKLIQYSLFDLLAEPTPVIPEPEPAAEVVEEAQPGSPGYEYDTDGITVEMLESIEARLPKTIKAKVSISLAQGKSGMWYMGRSLALYPEGSGYAAWPKFSEQYASRYRAFSVGANSALQWFRERKMKAADLLCIRKELERIAADINPVEFHHDAICQEWRECGYSEKCMTQDEAGDTVCFKDELKKQAGQKEEQTLGDLCLACKTAHPGCNNCCAHCQTTCNAGQRCSWPGVENPKELANTELTECPFSRDQLKLLDVGFSLVRYTREEKRIELITSAQQHRGWCTLDPFTTYAAAERKLKELKDQGCIETDQAGKIVMSGWNQPDGLLKAGFEFYRCYGLHEYEQGCCIKQGSKNWSNWGKYSDRAELETAWNKLMNEDSKALQG